MSQNKRYINISARIFFNTCFLTFTVFGLYISFCEAYRYNGDYVKIFIISLILSFTICVLWMNSNIFSNIGLLSINLGIIVIIIKNYKLIEKELDILYNYIKRQYYIYMNLGDLEVNTKRSYIMLFGKPVYEKLTLIIIIVVLIMIIAMSSIRIRCSFLVMLPVVILIGIEMLHGKAPSLATSSFLVIGVLGLIFGIKLEMYGGKKNFFQKRHVSGQIWTRYIIFTVIIIVSIIISVYTGSYTKDKVFKNSEKALQQEHKMERQIKIMAETIKSRVFKEKNGYLDNKSPNQTGKFIMRIETDKMPADNIYLRSFYANEYNGTRWNNSDKKSPLSEDNVNHMFSNGVEQILNYTISDIDTIKITVFPEEKNFNSLKYIPYMLKDLEKNNTDCYSFYCYNPPRHVKNYILTIDNENINNYKKYNLYVDKKYLSLPHNVNRLKKFANKIDSYPETDLQCIAVKNAICKDTKYSQTLKALPDGKDYIEYFLFEQKKGYCEHYATAGTILLRFKGVPARYAAGYNINPFEFSAEYDDSGAVKYVAYVRDYNAHAWTEVYKNGFGWIPFDMTNEVVDDSYNGNIALNPMGVETPDLSSSDIEDNEKNFEKISDNSSIQEDTNETENVQNKKSENNDGKKTKSRQNSKYNIGIMVAAGLFISFLLIVIITIIYNRIKFVLLFKKLNMATTSNERVIIYFSILNHFLGFCGIKNISELEDAEYTGKLYSVFSEKIPKNQINNACEILQCAAFSNNDIGHDREDEVVSFIKNASYKAYQSCKKPLRFIIYVFTGKNVIY